MICDMSVDFVTRRVQSDRLSQVTFHGDITTICSKLMRYCEEYDEQLESATITSILLQTASEEKTSIICKTCNHTK